MRRTLLILAILSSLATATAAQDNGKRVSLGYAYLKYLVTDGGYNPTGAYLSLSGGGRTTVELDVGYHRNTDFSINTFTLLAGPKFSPAAPGRAEPYLHLLGGVRHDTIRIPVVDDSNTALGGMAGAGVDVRASKKIGVRLGADFQIFIDEGENVQTLRLIAGLTF